MKLPEPTTEQLLDKMMKDLEPQMQQIHRTSSDTAVSTPGLLSAVLLAGVVFAAISPWWLLLAVPLAIIAWGCEIKWWRKTLR
jgi:hypothetical protein